MPIRCPSCGRNYKTDDWEEIGSYTDRTTGRKMLEIACPQNHITEIPAWQYELEKRKEKKREVRREEKRQPSRFLCPNCGKRALKRHVRDGKTVLYSCPDIRCNYKVKPGDLPAAMETYEQRLNQEYERNKPALSPDPRSLWRRVKKRKEVFGSYFGARKGIKNRGKEKREEYLNKRMKGIKGSLDTLDQESEDLYQDYEAGNISREEYMEEKKKIDEERERYEEEERRITGGKAGERISYMEHWGDYVMQSFSIIIFVAFGLATSIFFRSYMFMGAFLCWMMVHLLPEGEIPEELLERTEINVKWKDVRGWLKSAGKMENTNAGFGVLRSMFKMTSISLFIFAIRGGQVPFPNILLMITAFVGYYSLKLTYEPNRPSSVIESTVRLFVGFIVIPFWVVYHIFQSMVLVFIAIAFFAIPPMPRKKSEEGSYIFMNYFMFDRFIFAGFMLLALFGSGVLPIPGIFGLENIGTWKLTGALKSTFLWFWLVTGIAGFFSSPETRPVTGFFMLGAATIIYGLGPGTNEVIQGLLGPWGPMVYNTVANAVEPMNEAFNQLTNTFGQAITLLVNPVGYAQQIMNGSYTTDPTTNIKGAYGVEIQNIRVTPIYPYQPFTMIVKLKNLGAFPAENVKTGIYLDPSVDIVYEKGWEYEKWGKQLFITDFGFSEGPPEESEENQNLEQTENKEEYEMPHLTCEKKETEKGRTYQICTQPEPGNMTKLDVRQILFISNGVRCENIADFGLREKFLPFIARVTYDYKIHSSLEMTFITEEEWRRKIQQEQFLTQQKKGATFTNAPVQLNIGAPEQPVREGIPFFIGLQLGVGPRGGKIENVSVINLTLPEELSEFLISCSPLHTSREKIKETKDVVLTWKKKDILNSKTIYCQFNPMDFKELNTTGPEKTFQVKSSSDYTFSKERKYNTQIEFGGGCCGDKDCIGDQVCTWEPGMEQTGNCRAEKPEEQPPEETEVEDEEKTKVEGEEETTVTGSEETKTS